MIYPMRNIPENTLKDVSCLPFVFSIKNIYSLTVYNFYLILPGLSASNYNYLCKEKYSVGSLLSET